MNKYFICKIKIKENIKIMEIIITTDYSDKLREKKKNRLCNLMDKRNKIQVKIDELKKDLFGW